MAQWVQRFGDAEIQQLDLLFGRHQHVAGLQVAVHQQLAVGVGHGVGELQEQRQPRRQRQHGASTVDGLPDHALHHEIGQAVGGESGVQHVRDVRVRHPRQRLLFLRETFQHGGGIHAALQHLDRRLADVGAVGALGQPDVAHATRAQPRDDAPRAQQLAFAAGLRRPFRHGRVREEVTVRTGRGRVAVGQQRTHFGQHRRR